MSRYFTRARPLDFQGAPVSWIEAIDQPMIPNLTVDDHIAVDTGLVDQSGDPIMRAPNPIGFGRDGEW